MRNAALIATMMGMCAAAGAQTTPWSYLGKDGPMNWGKLDPAYRACRDGHAQSPIDIRGAHLNKALPALEFHYIGEAMTVENNGLSIVVHPDPGSSFTYDGVRYDLKEMVFHRPSETAVHGRLDDMDVEFLHQSRDGQQAVIEVRLVVDMGEANATLAMLWGHLPANPGATERITDMVNPGGLLPGDYGYWTYTGSLSTPPCTEGVRWFVMEQELSVSRTQLQQYTDMFRVSSRPLQDGHGRRIEANE
ncbi:MAG: carbonic anhydrase family protein [Terracidiphilus sp.]